MNTRILKVRAISDKTAFFVPQQQINGRWHEFFGFDPGSPYLHPRAFGSLKEVREFLTEPSIWKVGRNGSEYIASIAE